MRSPEYEPVFSAKAWEVLLACSRRRQGRIARLAHALADFPFRVGDYQTLDSTGRSLENLRIDGFVFTYWPDHGAKELRIVDLVEL
jgi:hypothetical protein